MEAVKGSAGDSQIEESGQLLAKKSGQGTGKR